MPDQPAPNLEEARRIAEEFPKLFELVKAYDIASRLGAVGGTLEEEADRLLRRYLALLGEVSLLRRQVFAALPATESAQAETDRDRNSGHSPEEVVDG